MSIPELVAHRGYARRFPENTLIAVQAAADAGARFIEIDVQLSRDGVPVLFHDRTLARLCGVAGAVHELTWTQLQDLRASEFERFGYKFAQNRLTGLREFAEFLRTRTEVTAFVEIKRAALAQFGIDATLAAVSRELQGLDARVILISFSLELLAAARAQQRADAACGWHAIGAVIDTWRERQQAALKRLSPEYLFCDVDGLPRFGRLDFGAAKLVIYEVADADTALRLHRRGVHMIETFAIGELSAQLALAAG